MPDEKVPTSESGLPLGVELPQDMVDDFVAFRNSWETATTEEKTAIKEGLGRRMDILRVAELSDPAITRELMLTTAKILEIRLSEEKQ